MGDVELKNKFSPLENKSEIQETESESAQTLTSEIGDRKRKTLPSLDSEDSGSPISKKINHLDSDSSFDNPSTDSNSNNRTMEEQLDSIQRRLDKLATSDELSQLRENFRTTLTEEIGKLTREIDHISSTFKEQIAAVESRIFDTEVKIEKTEKENDSLRQELDALKNEMTKTREEMNDHQQYQRRWNLRLFNVPQTENETVEMTTLKVCQIFTDLVGVETTPEDIEVAHRVGPASRNTATASPAQSGDSAAGEAENVGSGARIDDQATEGETSEGGSVPFTNSSNNFVSKPSAVIVRFKFRGKRDLIIKKRSNLKKKKSKVSICEDLTKYNLDACNAVYKHPATENSWSVSGKIFCKLKQGGRKFRIPYGVDVQRYISMKARE